MNIQQLAALCGLAFALLLPGCGPGLTGTGTGASAVGLNAFNATEQAVCGAPFARVKLSLRNWKVPSVPGGGAQP